MRRDQSSGGDMSDRHLTDREVELILAGSRTGSDDLASLERLVAGLSRTTPPHDAEHMATVLAATARSTRRTRGLRRMATIAASAALLVAMSGVAMAADRAAPGDALYGIDRTLEAIGIGDGGVDERLDEFDVLLERGNEEKAFEFLEEVIADSPEAEASEAEQHLEAAADSKPTARDNNGRNEQALESSPGQVTSTERSSDSQKPSDAEESGSEPGGNAIGQDDGAEPPGQEKTNENRVEPDTAGSKDDNPSEQNDNKSEEDNENNGQPDHSNPQNDNDPPGQNKSD